MTKRRFVALDRDGTVVEEKFHLTDPADLALIPQAAVGMRQMRDMGLGLILITNQSVIGSGKLDEAGLATVHQKLGEMLAGEEVTLDGIFYCPHTAQDSCHCRKPKPGLLEEAAEKIGFDLSESFLIGDKASDIESGQAVGVTTFLVKTGYGAQVAEDGSADPDYVVADLPEAARAIQGILSAQNTKR